MKERGPKDDDVEEKKASAKSGTADKDFKAFEDDVDEDDEVLIEEEVRRKVFDMTIKWS